MKKDLAKIMQNKVSNVRKQILLSDHKKSKYKDCPEEAGLQRMHQNYDVMREVEKDLGARKKGWQWPSNPHRN